MLDGVEATNGAAGAEHELAMVLRRAADGAQHIWCWCGIHHAPESPRHRGGVAGGQARARAAMRDEQGRFLSNAEAEAALAEYEQWLRTPGRAGGRANAASARRGRFGQFAPKE